jgi:hypothetical protein
MTLSLARFDRLFPFGPLWTRRRDLNRAIDSAYDLWRRRFPRWANAGFDDYFLHHDARDLLAGMLGEGLQPDAHQLAQKWLTVYGFSPERQAHSLAEVTLVAAVFLTLLQAEYCGQ